MGRGGEKLAKLKSVLKKLNSFGHQNRRHAINSAPAFASSDNGDSSSLSSSSTDLCPVYVGQSRRRYLVGSAVARHPLFRELAARSSNGVPSPDSSPSLPLPSPSPGEDSSLSIACEVVLFEHLLWMLENAESRPEPLDELVEFYAY
ncbi:auxin-responsive protein SAUR76-like [Rhodamnia argentea]|uniref:Auxin-responsive protein SAUR76-like n=1 Tax=Rhodamnia argentea TaxID=178133 RepID=A0A8B8PUL5_9MYRT|nr:auxin-responsive protein SAUR76-like [Rhodamnia argentea]